jgi:hypothetical protein
MEQSELTVIASERCEHLRWKGMFIEAMPDPTVQQTDDRLFWCQKTQICLGPDGRLADDFECNPARPCYRAL